MHDSAPDKRQELCLVAAYRLMTPGQREILVNFALEMSGVECCEELPDNVIPLRSATK